MAVQQSALAGGASECRGHCAADDLRDHEGLAHQEPTDHPGHRAEEGDPVVGSDASGIGSLLWTRSWNPEEFPLS